MSISAVSHHRGGTAETVLPLVRRMQAVLLKHGVLYRLCRIHAGPNLGDWLTIVQYRDQAAYDKAQTDFAQDPEYQAVVADIAQIATQISREVATDVDL